MKIRNPFAIVARQRKAGPMRARPDLSVDGLTFVCVSCGEEEEAALPHRTTRVRHRVHVCSECRPRLGLKLPDESAEE